MMLFRRLLKPWYIHKPLSLLKRLRHEFAAPDPGYRLLKTSWGDLIRADPTRTIGESIDHFGFYDLSLSECLCRLIDPADLVVDVGANIGYCSLLASVRSESQGQVLPYEPHPDLYTLL